MTDNSDQRSITLFHAVPSRSAIVRWMLEELGVSYEIELINFQAGQHLEPAYLKINPMGKVPALRHGEAYITEVAAICCYLADEFPDSGLAPRVGDPSRGPYLKWLFYAPSCIEPAFIAKSQGWTGGSRGMIGWGDYDTVLATLRDALSNASPYLLGEQFTAADVVIGSQIRFGLMFGTLPKEPIFEAYAALLELRPALQRQIAKDEELSKS